MNCTEISDFYEFISNHHIISEEVLNNLSDITGKCIDNDYSEFDEEYQIKEITQFKLPSDFVKAVFSLNKHHFWYCFRYNTFEHFEQLSIYKTLRHPKIPDKTYQVKRMLRHNSGYDYKDWIYQNRYHLLYITRFQLLKSCMLFINSKEATNLMDTIQLKYSDINIWNLHDTCKVSDEKEEYEDQCKKIEEEDYINKKAEEKYELFLYKIKER